MALPGFDAESALYSSDRYYFDRPTEDSTVHRSSGQTIEPSWIPWSCYYGFNASFQCASEGLNGYFAGRWQRWTCAQSSDCPGGYTLFIE